MNDLKEMPMVRVTRMYHSATPGEGIKAFAEVVIAETYAVRGVRVMQDAKGSLFVSMPGQKKNDGVFTETFHPITKEGRKVLHKIILAHYNTGKGGKGGA